MHVFLPLNHLDFRGSGVVRDVSKRTAIILHRLLAQRHHKTSIIHGEIHNGGLDIQKEKKKNHMDVNSVFQENSNPK